MSKHNVLRKIRCSNEVSEEFDELPKASKRLKGIANLEGYKESFCERRHRGESMMGF